tara:strand:+ start:410 stop:784 length:375 start_codon:yes stop_codon:yes gene_type:complete
MEQNDLFENIEVVTESKKAVIEKLKLSTTDNLITMIERWHFDRNLIDGATDKDQVCKLIQEVGELSDNVCKQKDIADDIGDIMVVLINIAKRNGLSIRHCLEVAYHDIKDRKGKMVDGIFVKEE